MTAQDLYEALRNATEDDVGRILPRLCAEGARLACPPADLLEFYHRMIDELTGERAAWEEIDDMSTAAVLARHAARTNGGHV